MRTRKRLAATFFTLMVLFCLVLLAGQRTHAQDPDAEPLDSFGTTLARGDFNGDRYEDLAVGVYKEDLNDGIGNIINDAGAVEVIYGSASGLAQPNRQFWRPGIGNLQGVPKSYEFFGRALAAGDFNRDGYADLAIGAPGPGAGSVYVLYGSASGLWAPPTVRQNWHQGLAALGDAAESGDQFGFALAAGDFDRDGYADLAVGVPMEEVADVPFAGAVNIIYGSPSGLSLTATAARKSFWRQVPCVTKPCADAIGDGPQAGDYFGWSLAAGDFNDDRADDLAIGVPHESVGGNARAGAVNVLYGSISGLTATGNQFWHQDSPDIEDQAEVGDGFGSSLAAGDFNADWRSDLAIGVPGESFRQPGIDSIVEAGAVNVIYGSSAGLTASRNQFLHEDLEGIFGRPGDNEHFANALAAGDFNADGASDLAIAIAEENVGDAVYAGVVYVLYGTPGSSTAGLSLKLGLVQYWYQNSRDVEDASEQGDFFGWSLVAGRFNGERYSSLAIGVPGQNLYSAVKGLISAAGAVSVIYGSDPKNLLAPGLNATTPVPDQIWTQNIIRGNLP